jgi:hypothetical protein
MEEKTLKQASCETNVLYMMSLAMDLILRNNEWLMSRLRESFRRDKKQLFTRYARTVRDACYLQDLLTQDIFDADEKNDYRNIQIWQDEANELSRLVLLFADRSADQGVVDGIFKYIREQPGEGIVTEEMLESFYLKK